MLIGLYFYSVATCCTMRLPLFCFLLTSRPEDNVQKSMGKDSHKQKHTEHTRFREGQADEMLTKSVCLYPPLEMYQLRVQRLWWKIKRMPDSAAHSGLVSFFLSFFLSLSLSPLPTPFILRVPLDPAGAGPRHKGLGVLLRPAWQAPPWALAFLKSQVSVSPALRWMDVTKWGMLLSDGGPP